MYWEKLCPNLSFTIENKIGNLHKIGHFSKLTQCKIFQFLKFQEFINELRKICFPLGKMEFRIYWKFCACTEVLTLGKALLILLPLYL